MKGWNTRHWLLLAAVIRLIAAFTRVNWHYPDEWYQTIEFSRLILDGSASYTHEMALHMRNLSWPVLLCAPLAFADWIAPRWVHLRLIGAQLAAGALDFAAIVAFSKLARGWNGFWRGAGFALLILPWFQVQDSVGLGAEHISVCLIWITLAFLNARDAKWKRAAGVTALAIFAAKYPAGLVTAGFAVAIFWQALRARDWRAFSRFAQGCAAGVVLFGIPDWIFYGRPWESLWMYAQYNVFTASAVRTFGSQGLSAYAEFAVYRWMHVLLPIGVLLLTTGIIALVRGLRRVEPWAWAFAFYFGGHLLVSHREARFMFPAEALLIWGALKFAHDTWPDLSWRVLGSKSRWIPIAAAVVFALNLPLFLKAAIAETGTLNSSYFAIGEHLRENPRTCAVISQRMLSSVVIPKGFAAGPAIGFFSAQRRVPTFEQAESHALAWYVHAPSCGPSDTVLLLVDRPDVGWIEKGCKLERSGLLEILPQDLWVTALHRGWVSGPWYACDSSILGQFKDQVVEHPFIHSIPRYSALPPYGIDSQELEEFRARYFTSPQCRWTCT